MNKSATTGQKHEEESKEEKGRADANATKFF